LAVGLDLGWGLFCCFVRTGEGEAMGWVDEWKWRKKERIGTQPFVQAQRSTVF
jgi:hypothetical protein